MTKFVYFAVVLINLALAAPVPKMVRFEVNERACALRLTSVGDDYKVDRPSLPLGGIAYKTFVGLAWVRGFAIGRAFEIPDVGIGNRFDGSHGFLLKSVAEGPDAIEHYRVMIEAARSSLGPKTIALARTALDFTRGLGTGRAIQIDVTAPMRVPHSVQGQSMILLLPDATYPDGILVTAHGCLPTYRAMMNLIFDASVSHCGMVWPARIEEPADQRPPSVRSVSSPPPILDPDFVKATILK